MNLAAPAFHATKETLGKLVDAGEAAGRLEAAGSASLHLTGLSSMG